MMRENLSYAIQPEGKMKARDVMVSRVITVKPSASVREVAETLVKQHISAVPVVDDQGKPLGIVSEGDLLHRAEASTERRHSWWLTGLIGGDALASEYIKAHSRSVADVMTKQVITAAPDTPLHEIAALLERNSIKRVPIVENGRIVGIVSRANLVQALASNRKSLEAPVSDREIREKILAELNGQPWAHTALLNVTVNSGVVDVWGIAQSETERKAILVAAETVPGVRAVHDNMMKGPSTWAG
jgi:CBS domain-containing protein